MSDEIMDPPAGASVWEREIYSHVVEHTRREGKMLGEYQRVAETSDSKAFAYLVDLLLEDERRHHRHFGDLAATIKTCAELSTADPAIPDLDFDAGDRDSIKRLSKELLDHERDDAKELRRLQKQLRDVQDTTLWSLLVDVMLRDTEKHAAILDFVVRHS